MARLAGSLTKSHRVSLARQRAWNAFRVFKVFRAPDVSATADIGEANLQKYLLALHRAGYLRAERPKRNGKVGGHVAWRLVDNTGPRCPIVRKDGVYDPNQDRTRPYPQERTDDDAGIELDDRVA